jgi:hypothetical protein
MKKNKVFFINILLLFLVIGLSSLVQGQQLAFPHAEGFGRFSQGGRGGDVYHVTNLEDYQPKTDKPIPGSLRYGILTQEGPRTIVFDLSGTIILKEELRGTKSFLTIAGQTAPGDGITIRDYTYKLTGQQGEPIHDIIIRFIRFRLGDVTKQSGDGLSTNWINDLILDHISAGWTIDCIHDLRDAARFTMQWSVFAEALNQSTHTKGAHAMLSSYSHLYGNVTVHHNLMASSRNRHPTLGGGDRTDTTAIVDFRNNLVFNWASGTNFGQCRHNLINNYYKPGESTNYKENKPLRMKSSRATSGVGYLSGNFFADAPKEFNKDNYTAVDYNLYGTPGPTNKYIGTTRVQWESKTPFVSGGDLPKTDSHETTYRIVLERAGASLVRDAVDKRVVAGVADGTNRLIDSQTEVGGWPELKSKPAPIDSDADGMPDKWEKENKLNPSDPADRNSYAKNSKYTNLEVYLNSLVEHLYKSY